MIHRVSSRPESGLTLVELLIASTILSLITALTLQMVSGTTEIWQRTRSRIDTFQESRAAFESMTRKVSQAALNQHWDYVDAAGKPRDPALSGFVPKQYVRQSDLHFISGQANELLQDVPGSNGKALESPTHGVFFQAPLGFSEATTGSVGSASMLPTVLNESGYFIEFGDDAKFRPGFLKNNARAPLRNRFRLMEMTQSSESLAVYQRTAQAALSAAPNPTTLRRWFVDGLKEDASATSTAGSGGAQRVKRALAENVIALIILPKRSAHDGSPGAPELAPNFSYDTKLYLTTPSNEQAVLTRNQLPPLVQVTMVAIDEKSAERLESSAATPSTAPDLGLANLFTLSGQGVQLAEDLATLEQTLSARRITYRVFSTDVSILQAKWSDN
jgi:uncharacterized protein (TIGR02599 family)